MRIRDSTFFQLLILAIFIIVILHVSLKNLLQEPIFRTVSSSIELPLEDVLASLTGSSEKKEPVVLADSKEDLMKYIKKNLKDIESVKDIRVKGANYYGPYHQSDLHHEETDLSKYFQIDQSVPETTNMLQQLQCNRDDASGLCKQPVKPNTDNLTGNPLYFDQGSNGDLTYKPDIWVYDNERPMNGGVLDGVRGIDDMQSDYSIYPQSGNFSGANYLSSYPYTQSSGKW